MADAMISLRSTAISLLTLQISGTGTSIVRTAGLSTVLGYTR